MLYDVLIVGGGPAGLTAAIYSLRAGKKVMLIERMVPGGQIAYTKYVENYTGFKKIDGDELSTLMFEHAKSFGLEVVFSDVLDMELEGKIKTVRTHKGTFEGKTIILCLGASAKQLNLPNERKFIGRGVSYCATCDGTLFRDKNVAIVGGGSSSLEDCLYLAGLAKNVYLIHRRDYFKGEKILANEVLALSKQENPPVEILFSSAVEDIAGDDKLQSIVVKNLITNEKRELDVDALFIAIGRKPDTEILGDKINLDQNGYIITNEKMETSMPGVYAAGDVRQKQLRQIVTAASDGAIASVNTNEYILKTFGGWFCKKNYLEQTA